MANKSIWKNIKSVFVVEDEQFVSNQSDNTQVSKKKAAKETGSASTQKTAPSAIPQTGKPTARFMEVLYSAMEKNNIDGFDYIEYKQSLQSLAKMPMDEQTRYQSAFAMAKTMGATPQLLIDTAAHYKNVLAKEENKFEKALAGQQEQKIGVKQQEIKGLEATIKNKADQIKKLTEEIQEHQAKSQKLVSEIQNAAAKVETTKNNFIASYTKLMVQINQDIENMKKYLK